MSAADNILPSSSQLPLQSTAALDATVAAGETEETALAGKPLMWRRAMLPSAPVIAVYEAAMAKLQQPQAVDTPDTAGVLWLVCHVMLCMLCCHGVLAPSFLWALACRHGHSFISR